MTRRRRTFADAAWLERFPESKRPGVDALASEHAVYLAAEEDFLRHVASASFDDALSVREIAEVLGVSRGTAHNLVRRGDEVMSKSLDRQAGEPS